MNIYQIDRAILDLVDEETGEIKDLEYFDQLQMERDQKIENIVKLIKNTEAEAKAIKEEKDNLMRRQKETENTAAELKELLDYAIGGVPYKNGAVSIGYRKSGKTVVDDDFIEWAMENDESLLTFTEPKPNLSMIKARIKSGETFEHAAIETRRNIQIK